MRFEIFIDCATYLFSDGYAEALMPCEERFPLVLSYPKLHPALGSILHERKYT